MGPQPNRCNTGCLPSPWAHFLQHMLNMRMHVGSAPGSSPRIACPPFEHLLQGFLAKDGGGIASLMFHFGPHLAQCGLGSEIDKFAALMPELVSDFVKTIRECIDPFPQLQETHIAIDKVVQMNDFGGLGSAAEGLLRCIVGLPVEQQKDIYGVLFEGMAQKFLQLVPPEALAAPEAVHVN